MDVTKKFVLSMHKLTMRLIRVIIYVRVSLNQVVKVYSEIFHPKNTGSGIFPRQELCLMMPSSTVAVINFYVDYYRLR